MALHKSWRWVGAFGPDAMLCVAHAQVGVLRRSWWAVWDGERLHEGTRATASTLTLEHGTPIEVTTGPAWTRKTPLRVTGTVARTPRSTRRACSTSPPAATRAGRRGAGRRARASPSRGAHVVWNLVDGLHDGSPSERTVWVDGEPHEVAAPAVRRPRRRRRPALHRARHAREARELPLLIASDYEQPFGTFAARCRSPAALRGWGVMERHEALW